MVFLKGEESYFRLEVIRAAKRTLSARGFEVEVLDAATVSPRELLGSLESTSLFSAKKLVIITNTEKVKGKAAALCARIQDPEESVVAIFDGNGDVATPLGKALAEHVHTFESNPLNPYKGEVEKWLVRTAADMGKGLSKDLARAIHNGVGADLHALRGAVQKVVYHCDEETITKTDIRAVLQKTSGNQTYELTNALGARDLKRALYFLDSFYRTEDDPSLLLCSSLLKHIERLIRAKSLLEYGLDAGDAARVLKMHPFLFKTKLAPQLKNYKLDELIDMMTHLCKVDILLKGSGLDRKSQLDNFLIRFLA